MALGVGSGSNGPVQHLTASGRRTIAIGTDDGAGEPVAALARAGGTPFHR
jgi:hypothetical protein